MGKEISESQKELALRIFWGMHDIVNRGCEGGLIWHGVRTTYGGWPMSWKHGGMILKYNNEAGEYAREYLHISKWSWFGRKCLLSIKAVSTSDCPIFDKPSVRGDGTRTIYIKKVTSTHESLLERFAQKIECALAELAEHKSEPTGDVVITG